MYNYLLTNGDQIQKLDIRQKIEVQDYINMRRMGIVTLSKYNYIKSICITKHGVTIWQLVEKYLNSLENRAIGQLEAPLSLIEWMLGNTSQTAEELLIFKFIKS